MKTNHKQSLNNAACFHWLQNHHNVGSYKWCIVSVLFMPRFRITFEADTVMVLLFICLFVYFWSVGSPWGLYESLEKEENLYQIDFFSLFFFFFGSFTLVTLRSVKGKVCKKFSWFAKKVFQSTGLYVLMIIKKTMFQTPWRHSHTTKKNEELLVILYKCVFSAS